MEDNEVELKDAKPGMWATFDITEPIDNSYGRVEPGHYEGAILEPTEGHMFEETICSIMYGHDVTWLCVDGSAVGLEEGELYVFAVIKNGKPFTGPLTNVHIYKTKPVKTADRMWYVEIPRDKTRFYIDGNDNAWCVDEDGNAWRFANGQMSIEYKGDDTSWAGPFRKAKLVAA